MRPKLIFSIVAVLVFYPCISGAAALVPYYRLNNPNSGEYMYTESASEYNALGTMGWIQEGITCYLYNGVFEIDSVNSQPFYRVFNPNSGQHHWTMDGNEYDILESIGWTKEGAAGYIYQTQVTGSAPLYRLYYPPEGLHLWTMDQNEQVTLISYGWIGEGIAGYVFSE